MTRIECSQAFNVILNKIFNFIINKEKYKDNTCVSL